MSLPDTSLSVVPVRRSSILRSMFRRMIFGLLFILPILLTVLVVWEIYYLLNAWVITPVAWLILPDDVAARAAAAEAAKAASPEVVLPKAGGSEAVWPAIKQYVTPP